MQRGFLLTLIGLVILAAALIILNIWGVDLGEIFYKILGTLVVLIVLVGFLMVVKMDFGEHKRLKDEGYLD
jgi:surface polysaccharide O-acyltransferase-like enzyme